MVQLQPYMLRSKEFILQSGGVFLGSAYALPEGFEPGTEAFDELEDLAQTDLLETGIPGRMPVRAHEAAALKDGDVVDFDGMGVFAIAAIGKSFRAEASPHDPRLAEMTGEQVVYVYNERFPLSQSKTLSQSEKRLKREQHLDESQARREQADKMRIPVPVGRVDVGGRVKLKGKIYHVAALGKSWELAEQKDVDRIRTRFPDLPYLVLGAHVQFAKLQDST